MERKQVYERIDGERDYQDKHCAEENFDVDKRAISSHILTLELYLDKCKQVWGRTSNAKPDPTMDVMRKVAAIAVRCLEEWGCPERRILGADVDADVDANVDVDANKTG